MSRFKPTTIAGLLVVLTLTVGCLYRAAPVVSEEESRKEADEESRPEAEDGTDRPVAGRLNEVTAEVRDVTQSNNDFALDLYARLAGANKGNNLFFSPYSMSSALAMVAEGARSETADEMGKTLRYPASARRKSDAARPWDMDRIHTGQAALNDHLLSGGRPAAEKESNRRPALRYELRIANALWGEKTYPFKQSYLDTIDKHYHTGGLFAVDFRNNSESARGRINAWVEKQTHQRIKDMLSRDVLKDASTVRLILTNAIYFKGAWSEMFEERQTQDDDFLRGGGARVRVPMMSKHMESARYAAFRGDGTFFDTPTIPSPGDPLDPKSAYPDERGFVLLELPYKGDELAMVVILPRSADGLAGLERGLTAAKVQTWIAELQQRDVDVLLPKFKLETKYEMGKALQAMGMVRAFRDPIRPNGAQFDGMSESVDPREKLYVSKVVHKAFVEVNEKGTEAAASTAVIMGPPISPPPFFLPFTPTFRADRPFLFLIRDVKTGSILFLGRVTNPKG